MKGVVVWESMGPSRPATHRRPHARAPPGRSAGGPGRQLTSPAAAPLTADRQSPAYGRCGGGPRHRGRHRRVGRASGVAHGRGRESRPAGEVRHRSRQGGPRRRAACRRRPAVGARAGTPPFTIAQSAGPGTAGRRHDVRRTTRPTTRRRALEREDLALGLLELRTRGRQHQLVEQTSDIFVEVPRAARSASHLWSTSAGARAPPGPGATVTGIVSFAWTWTVVAPPRGCCHSTPCCCAVNGKRAGQPVGDE